MTLPCLFLLDNLLSASSFPVWIYNIFLKPSPFHHPGGTTSQYSTSSLETSVPILTQALVCWHLVLGVSHGKQARSTPFLNPAGSGLGTRLEACRCPVAAHPFTLSARPPGSAPPALSGFTCNFQKQCSAEPGQEESCLSCTRGVSLAQSGLPSPRSWEQGW